MKPINYNKTQQRIAEAWVCNVPAQERGDLKIEKFSVSEEAAWRFNLNCHGRPVYPGDYTKLTSKEEFWMSDTRAELLDHATLFNATCCNELLSNMDVLVFGLGIGCALNVMLEVGREMKLTRKITVIEINPDIIAMVQPTFQPWIDNGQLEIIEADALEWKAPKGSRWGVVWCDIWPDITPDNIPEMKKLRTRYHRRCMWVGCWAEWECKNFFRVAMR